jgi:dUTPase
MFAAKSGCLFANIPKDAAGQTTIRMSHRTTLLVDCGVSIKVPMGFRLKIALTREFANRGLMITDYLTTDERVKVLVTNIGKELVVINKGDNLANAWLEPLYLSNWITK